MTRKKLLLTGGAGMVGRNIQEHPLAGRWEIISPRSKELDLTDFRATREFFCSHSPDFVVHSAGRVGGIQANVAHPVDFLVTNTDMARNVLLAARDSGVERLINIASSCMYPHNAPNPLSESLVLQGALEPTNEGYALAKIFATRLCQYINFETPGVHYKTLIPCNLFGRYDKFEPHHSHLIPAIIHKIHMAKVKGLAEVEVWGDGSTRREFMYAGDLADAVFRALDSFDSLPDLMNIGLGKDFSVKEYYTLTAEVLGWHGRFVHDLNKPIGMKQKIVDIQRQQAWGWASSTTLKAGIEMSYQYYLQDKRA